MSYTIDVLEEYIRELEKKLEAIQKIVSEKQTMDEAYLLQQKILEVLKDV